MKPPPLPKGRVTENHAFQIIGLDCAGPLFLRSHSNNSTKTYICLFTCANTRAIYLELAEDLTAEAFINAVKRFISRRGCPEHIISDNAKNFKAGSTEILAKKKEILETAHSQRFLVSHGITWEFTAEGAPWWELFYERLIGLTKRCIKKKLGQASLKTMEMITVLKEAEAVLNSRSLTHSLSDINDMPPLTPSHFLCGYRPLNLPDTQGKQTP